MHGFGDVFGAQGLAGGQVGNRARNLEHAVIGACRKAETLDRLFEQGFASGIGMAMPLDLLDAKLGVGFALPGDLAVMDQRADIGIGKVSGGNAGTSTCKSMRSSSGPEILPR